MFQYDALEVAKDLWRVTCQNPSALTGPGTNTYILKTNMGCVVVDPGPIDDAHETAIIECCGGYDAIAAIFVTHMHSDHSPLAAVLAKKAGVDIYGPTPLVDDFQDKTCQPNIVVEHEQAFSFGQYQLIAVHTPGHIDNHYCFYLKQQQVMLAGDHVMQGSTVVIIPPHGDMKAYLTSLQLLKSYAIKQLLPAHGEPMEQVHAAIDGITEHRLNREKMIIEALQKLQQASLDDLLPDVYGEIDQALWPMAKLSMEAHLLKLEQENISENIDDIWHFKNKS